MKQILSSLKDNALTRIRNPLIGAFAFSWCVLNIKGLSLFLLSSNSEKKHIVLNWEPNFVSDIAWPLLLSFFYLAVLPWLHVLYLALDEGVIARIKQNIKNRSLIAYYRGLRATNERKMEADEQYIATLKEANVLTWPNEKKRMSAIVMEERKQLAKKISEMVEIEEKLGPTLESNSLKNEIFHKYVDRLSTMERALASKSVPSDHLKIINLIRHDLIDILNKNKQPINLVNYYAEGIFTSGRKETDLKRNYLT